MQILNVKQATLLALLQGCLLAACMPARSQELAVHDGYTTSNNTNWVRIDGVGPGWPGITAYGNQVSAARERAGNAASRQQARGTPRSPISLDAYRQATAQIARFPVHPEELLEAQTALNVSYGSVSFERDRSATREDVKLARSFWLNARNSDTPIGLMLQDMESSAHGTTILVNAKEDNNTSPRSWEDVRNGTGSGTTIRFDPKREHTHYPARDGRRFGESILVHEATHAWRLLNGTLVENPHTLISQVHGRPFFQNAEIEATLMENWYMTNRGLCADSADCARKTYGNLVEIPGLDENPLIIPIERFTYPKHPSKVQH